MADAILETKGVADSGEFVGQDRGEAFETYKVITGQLLPTLDNLEPFSQKHKLWNPIRRADITR